MNNNKGDNAMTCVREYIRNPHGRGYQSKDGKWLIQNEGSNRCWFAAQLGNDTYPMDETKSYFRSVQECKDYIAWKDQQKETEQ